MKHKITFLPDKVLVNVDDNTNLFKAVKAAGVYVLSSCGGKGNCGKCKVIIKEGAVESGKSRSYPVRRGSGTRLRPGVRLARQGRPDRRDPAGIAHAGQAQDRHGREDGRAASSSCRRPAGASNRASAGSTSRSALPRSMTTSRTRAGQARPGQGRFRRDEPSRELHDAEQIASCAA